MKRFLIYFRTVCLSALFLPLAGCWRRDPSALLETGDARLAAKDYAAAARYYASATRHVTDSVPLYYNLGTAYYHAGNFDAAVTAFEAALRIDPVFPPAQEFLAASFCKLQSFDKAEAILTRLAASALRSDQPRLLNALAIVRRGLGQPDLANLHLNRAMRLDPRYAPTYYNLGNLLRDSFKLYTEAVDHYELYLRLAPEGEPHVEEARDKLRRTRALGAGGIVAAAGRASIPAGPVLRALNEGDAHYQSRRWSQAAAAYERALAADLTCYDAAIRLGYARQADGKLPAAIKAFARAGEILPAKPLPLYLQAYAAYSMNDMERAAQLLTSIGMPRWPNHAANYELMAYIRASQKRYPEALLYAGTYTELAPTATTGLDRFRVWMDKIPKQNE